MLGKKVPDKLIGTPFVYFVTEDPFKNLYKIGRTSSKTSDRLKALQTGSSADLMYDFIIPVCTTIKLSSVEHLFHEFYATVRRSISGKLTEWFKLTIAEARKSNIAFVQYKNLYVVDKIVDLDCFREILLAQKTNNKLKDNTKNIIRKKVQVTKCVKLPILIDLTIDESITMPEQKRDFNLRSNSRSVNILVDMVIDMPQIIDIAQEIANMTARMKYLSLV